MKFIYKIIYVSLICTYYEINCEQNSKNGLHYYFNYYINTSNEYDYNLKYDNVNKIIY